MMKLEEVLTTPAFTQRTQYKAGKLARKAALDSLLAALKECIRARDIRKGKNLHCQAIQTGDICDKYVGNSLINMYAKCGRVIHARNVFDTMVRHDVISWNTLLHGYVENGQSRLALEEFHSMKDSCSPDARSYLAGLTACATLAGDKDGRLWLEHGKSIHSQAVVNKCCDIFLESRLVDMYAKYGSMTLARSVFDGMANRDVVCWNALLQGYAENGDSELALELFDGMETVEKGCSPNARTFLAALTACSALVGRDRQAGKCMEKSKWFVKGKAIHSRASNENCCDFFVENALVDLYAKAGNMQLARDVFNKMTRRDVASWNVLLQGYAENGEGKVVLDLLKDLEDGSGGVGPDARTYVAALAACAELATREDKITGSVSKCLERAEAIYFRAKNRSCCDRFVETALINVYGKCRSMSKAQSLFNEMEELSVVTWSCLAQGFVDSGENDLALRTVARMDLDGIVPNAATFVPALMACGKSQNVARGKEFHAESQLRGFDKDMLVATAVMDFYGKCGNIEAATAVFESIRLKDVWAWNTFMSVHGQQGNTSAVFEVFERMKRAGFAPNDITFTEVLTTCSHAGLTDKGLEIFYSMKPRYGVTPDIMHYNCVVDLLARANRFEEALELVSGMPFEANAVTWTAILGGCRKWNNVEVGQTAYEALLKLDETDPGAYILMSNIYGSRPP